MSKILCIAMPIGIRSIQGVGVRWGLDSEISIRGTPFFVGDSLSYVEEASKVKAQTFKQYRLDRLIKDGTVIPASKLAEAKSLELQRSRDFEASIEDEERHRKTAKTVPEDKLKDLPLTRERFED